MREGNNGVTVNTPKKVVFGAGTIHKGLKYETGTGWNYALSLVGATSGGSKLTITPEIYDVPADGALVPVMGLRKKVGEKATLEVNMLELNKDFIMASTIGESGTSDDKEFALIQSKSDIVTDDYWENIAFVGETIEGKKIIVILPNAICTSGFDHESKNKESAVVKYTFECHADPAMGGDLDTLPWKIYYPNTTA